MQVARIRSRLIEGLQEQSFLQACGSQAIVAYRTEFPIAAAYAPHSSTATPVAPVIEVM
jgi:hypothetical protein